MGYTVLAPTTWGWHCQYFLGRLVMRCISSYSDHSIIHHFDMPRGSIWSTRCTPQQYKAWTVPLLWSHRPHLLLLQLPYGSAVIWPLNMQILVAIYFICARNPPQQVKLLNVNGGEWGFPTYGLELLGSATSYSISQIHLLSPTTAAQSGVFLVWYIRAAGSLRCNQTFSLPAFLCQ